MYIYHFYYIIFICLYIINLHSKEFAKTVTQYVTYFDDGGKKITFSTLTANHDSNRNNIKPGNGQ